MTGRLTTLIFMSVAVSMATWVIVGSLSMQLYHQPFGRKESNKLEAVALGVLFVR